MPRSISVCAPMMERVRPAQLTTILVVGSGTRSPMRSASSPFGQQMPPGMFICWNSAKVRPSTIDEILARVAHRLQAVRRHARRVPLLLDQLAEGLARHVDAGIERVARRAASPARRPPGRARCVAKRLGTPRRALGNAVAAVAQHQPHRRVRHQRRQAQLEAAVGQRHGEEQMRLAELAVLAHVEERDLAAIREPGLQRGRIDLSGHVLSSSSCKVHVHASLACRASLVLTPAS